MVKLDIIYKYLFSFYFIEISKPFTPLFSIPPLIWFYLMFQPSSPPETPLIRPSPFIRDPRADILPSWVTIFNICHIKTTYKLHMKASVFLESFSKFFIGEAFLTFSRNVFSKNWKKSTSEWEWVYYLVSWVCRKRVYCIYFPGTIWEKIRLEQFLHKIWI